MFLDNIKTGWNLGLFASRFAFANPKLLILPLLSVTAMFCALCAIFYAVGDHSGWAMIVVSCLMAYFGYIYIAIFFNVSLIASVNHKLEGREISIIAGFKVAFNRTSTILFWTLVAGSVGLFIRMIEALEDKFHIPSILSFILDVGWAAATYFVLPIICFQGNNSPKGLYQESVRLIQNVWGRGVVKIIGASLFVMVITSPVIMILLLIGYYASAPEMAPYKMPIYATIGSLIALIIGFATIINGTLQTIFYKYADVKYLPPGLSENLINQAVVRKQI